MAMDEKDLASLNEQIRNLSEKFNELSKASGSSKDVTDKSILAAQKALAALKMLGKASQDVKDALVDQAKAMYRGEQGAAAYSSSLDAAIKTTQVFAGILAIVFPPLRLVSIAFIGLSKILGTYTKETAKQSDNIYKAFQGLSRAGAVGADGMQSLYTDMKKLGLGVQDLDKMVRLVAENSDSLALFGGSVTQGRKNFAAVSGAMDKYSISLRNAGMTQDEINEATAGYIRLQGSVGQIQKKSADEVAASTYKYIQEQDALTKLTGMSRKEQEEALEAVRSQEMFGAKLEQLRQQGRTQEAAELERTYLMLQKTNKQAAQGFADISTGNLRTEAAQKEMRASQGESMRVVDQISSGQLKAAEAADRVANAHISTVNTMGTTQGMLGNYNKVYGDFAGDIRLRSRMLAGGFADMEKEIKADQERQGVTGQKAVDAELQRQSEMREQAQQNMHATQDFIRYGVEPATRALQSLGDAASWLISKIPGVNQTPIGKPETPAAGGTPVTPPAAVGAQVEQTVSRLLSPTGMLDRVTSAVGSAAKGAAGSIAAGASGAYQSAKSAVGRLGSVVGGMFGGGAAPPAPPAATGGGTSTSPPTTGPSGGTAAEGLPQASVKPNLDVQIGNQLRKGGTVSWRTNNPGNISYADITKKYGALAAFINPNGDKQQRTVGIAIMPSLEAGENAQMDLWRRPLYINRTIAGATKMWTKGENSEEVTAYAMDLAKAAGVDVTTRVKDLSESQLRSLVQKQKHWEGFKPGTVVQAAEGGVFNGPQSGYPATLHGTEAVIPLDNSAGNFVKLFEEMTVNGRELLGVMSELLRVSKNSVDVQQKILRMQS